MEPDRSPIGAPVSAGLDLRAERTYTAREYLDKEEAAAVVGLASKTIERAILRGELRAYKPRGRVRIHRDDLDAWIRSAVVTPTIHDI
jgi:excisionase family DNA binding protein